MVGGRPGPTSRLSAREVRPGAVRVSEDVLTTEEPLEIRLVVGRSRYPAAVTMRTPGADFELAIGFLFNEGILTAREQLRRADYCVDGDVAPEQRYNIVNVEVTGVAPAALSPLERHFSVTSACGVCGKATMEALHQRGYQPVPAGPLISAAVVASLPAKLRSSQTLFERTGGAHAAGLFTAGGELVAVREDVGRHNAMDKLAGWAFMNGRLPLAGHLLLVSGRSSFELVQKTLSMGAAALCSVSAPSSLAVELSREFGLTLIGFVRDERFKVYSGTERPVLP